MVKRAVAVAAIALTSLGVAVGPAAAAGFESTTTPASARSDGPALKPVRITAYQGTLNILNTKLDNLGAQLLDAITDEPIRGALINFETEGGRFLGKAYTDYAGNARLAAPENLGPGTVQEILNGYYASFVGDGVHTPVREHAGITVGIDPWP